MRACPPCPCRGGIQGARRVLRESSAKPVSRQACDAPQTMGKAGLLDGGGLSPAREPSPEGCGSAPDGPVAEGEEENDRRGRMDARERVGRLGRVLAAPFAQGPPRRPRGARQPGVALAAAEAALQRALGAIIGGGLCEAAAAWPRSAAHVWCTRLRVAPTGSLIN